MADIIEIDAATGVVTERDFHEHEKAQIETDVLLLEQKEKEKDSEQKKKIKVRKSALDKLKELGLTPAELKELFGE